MSVKELTTVHPILFWPWQYAPENYKKMSRHGGDEDWVALIPKSLKDFDYWIDRLEVCDIEKFILQNGDQLWIGAHA